MAEESYDEVIDKTIENEIVEEVKVDEAKEVLEENEEFECKPCEKVALKKTPACRIKLKDKVYLKGSYRAGVNNFSFYGTSNPSSYNNNIIMTRLSERNLIPKIKINDNKFYNSVEKKLSSNIDKSKVANYSQFPTFDLSKGFNIPGIIPKDIPLANQYILFPHEIEAIKQKAKEADTIKTYLG